MADFPPLALVGREDSSKRQETTADPVQRQEMEGGYTITRPRYTRRPRKTWTTGFTDITTAEKVLLQDFWDSKKGGSLSFTWTDPVSAATVTVRFKGPMSFQYDGVGVAQRWSVSGVQLEEV